MATPFSDVYDVFLSKIDDPDLLSMSQTDLEDTMQVWLMSSITMFPKCKKNLQDFDLTLFQFNSDLDLFEKDILASWMKYDYLNKQVYRKYLLTQSMSTKDNAIYSQAQHLKSLSDLRSSTYEETMRKVNHYLYNNLDYGTFA